MVQNMPVGWPEDVQPPGSEGWEATAVASLLDLVPEYRRYDMVCRHPVILASIARHLIHGSVEGAREGYRTIRRARPTVRARRRARGIPDRRTPSGGHRTRRGPGRAGAAGGPYTRMY